MSEPFFVAQTFETEHWASPLKWWKARGREAAAQGGTWPRYSWDNEGKGLLFECWAERPKNEGEPRWALLAQEDTGEAG